jgi:hypothetical protein
MNHARVVAAETAEHNQGSSNSIVFVPDPLRPLFDEQLSGQSAGDCSVGQLVTDTRQLAVDEFCENAGASYSLILSDGWRSYTDTSPPVLSCTVDRLRKE